MKIIFPDLSHPIEFNEGGFSSLVVENPKYLHRLMSDLVSQTSGDSGEAVLSIGDSPVPISKHIDLTTTVFPFELNRKNLVNKVVASMEHSSTAPHFFERTQALLSAIEQYISDLAFEEAGEVECDRLSVASLLKAVGVRLYEERETSLEKIFNYMELVREYDRDKLFVFVNLRSFFNDADMRAFVGSAISHKYRLLLIDNFAYPILPGESRLVVDGDLCEIY